MKVVPDLPQLQASVNVSASTASATECMSLRNAAMLHRAAACPAAIIVGSLS